MRLVVHFKNICLIPKALGGRESAGCPNKLGVIRLELSQWFRYLQNEPISGEFLK